MKMSKRRWITHRLSKVLSNERGEVGIEVPSVRGMKDAAIDWLWGAGAGVVMRAGRGIFGANFVSSLGIATLTGSVLKKDSRGETLSVMMGYHAFAGVDQAQAAVAPAAVAVDDDDEI